MQGVDAQRLLAQLQVAVHRGQVAVDGLDQRVVDLLGDLVLKQRVLARGGIAARLGKEHVLLDGGGVGGGDGVGKLVVALVVGVVGVLAHAAVGAFQQGDEAAVGQLHVHAVGVFDGAEGEVRVGEHGIDGVGGSGHLARLGQQLLLLGRERVLLQTQLALQRAAVGLQRGLLRKVPLDLFPADAQQLGGDVGGRRAQLHGQCLRAVGQRLIGGVAVVLVAAHAGVGEQPRDGALSSLERASAREQTLGAVQLALAGGDGRDLLLCRRIVLFPNLVGGVDVLQPPLIARVHLGALLHAFHIDSLLNFSANGWARGSCRRGR